MSVGRKLMISEQLGWITAGHVDSTLLKAADELADARQECREEMAIALGGGEAPAEPRWNKRLQWNRLSRSFVLPRKSILQKFARPLENFELA